MTTLNDVKTVPEDIRKELTEFFGFVPSFVRTLPAGPLRLWWSTVRDFQLSDKTALSNKVKELIGLGVSSQIPCHYCILFHTEAARLNGATETEIQEAIFMAALTRQGSTILNGAMVDTATFDRELKEIVAYVKKMQASMPAMGKKH